MNRKSTAEAPANLAFVKYWGKTNTSLRLPTNNSISMNLSEAKTRTTVEFDTSFANDEVLVLESDSPVRKEFTDRVIEHLDRVRLLAGVNTKALVTTRNTFPSSVGIASSASGFAALTVAASEALGLNLGLNELSALARLGSGSACRSIPDGFTEWLAGEDEKNSYAVQIAPPHHWDLRVVTVVVSSKAKKLSSTDGHTLAAASPFFQARLATMEKRLHSVRTAILNRDFETFGRETEMEAISFHTIAMTSPVHDAGSWYSGAYYWLPESLELMLAVQEWRGDGLGVYFTLDAGPTVHLLCLEKNVQQVISAVQRVEQTRPGRKWIVFTNAPSVGARVVE
jgi:diphosphomevalonate decarboxylase